MQWWVWVLIGWTALAVVLAVPVGLMIRVADQRSGSVPAEVPVGSPAAVPAGLATAPAPRPTRRRIPVPPVAAALAGVGVVLEAVGFVVRTTGNERGTAALLSMDQPLSLPRMYVTALFVAAAMAAFLGATRAPGRRAWWVGVGLVAVAVAQVKGGGTVHVEALDWFGVSGRPLVAAVGSAVVVGVVLTVLWAISRNERRGRRRVLIAFSLYGAAAVGLSAVSSIASQSLGASTALAAGATFVEESGEVLGGVAVLVAVLVSVAPRLVLPAAWALRRAQDAETIDAPGTLPAFSPGSGYLRG